MARLINGLFGNISGNVGNVQGSIFRGEGIVSSKKSHYHVDPDAPLTPIRQSYQRCLSLYRLLPYSFPKAFITDSTHHNSCFNEFFHLNLSLLKEGDPFVAAFPLFTNGVLPNCEYNVIPYLYDEGLRFVRLTDVGANSSFKPTDSFHVLVYDVDRMLLFHYNQKHRFDEDFHVLMPGVFDAHSERYGYSIQFLSSSNIPFMSMMGTMNFVW
jgi:hypothetical protein